MNNCHVLVQLDRLEQHNGEDNIVFVAVILVVKERV